MRFLLPLLLVACSGADGDDGTAGDDDDDDVAVDLTPWSEVVTTQEGTCCRTVLPAFEFTTVDHEGLPAIWAVPDDPVGALVVFHGTAGIMDTVQQTEWLELYNLLYPRGIAIIATISSDRDAKQWDLTPLPNNVDYPRVQTLLARVANETAFDDDLPLVSIGFSQGCGMADLMGEQGPEVGQDVVGVVVHNCSRSGPPGLPVLYVDAENDRSADGMASDASDHPQGTLLSGHEVPLDPNRFAKLEGFSQEDSQGVFDELIAMDVVDATGARIVDLGDDGEQVVTSIENNLPLRWTGDIGQQLRVVWSMHRLSAENKVEEAQWIEAQILR